MRRPDNWEENLGKKKKDEGRDKRNVLRIFTKIMCYIFKITKVITCIKYQINVAQWELGIVFHLCTKVLVKL